MGWMIEGMSAAAAVVVTLTRSQFSLQHQLLHLELNYRQHSTLQVDQFSNLEYVPVKTPLRINTIRHDREIRNSSPTRHISVEIIACKRAHINNRHQSTTHSRPAREALRLEVSLKPNMVQGANVTDHKHRPNSSSPRVSGKNGSSGTRFSSTVPQ